MLITSHIAAASLISAMTKRRSSAFLAGLASHLLMDRAPHWGGSSHDLYLKVARADGITGLILATHLLHRRPCATHLAALAGAVLPDIDKPSEHLLGVRILPPAVAAWLSLIQDESPDRLRREIAVALALAASAALAVNLTRKAAGEAYG